MTTRWMWLPVIAFSAVTLSAQEAKKQDAPQPDMPKADYDRVVKIARGMQKELVRIPQYGVFDDLRFGIKGSTVILRGYASRPILKSSAEQVTKNVPGVTEVVNQIEVLPLSPNDDNIRTRVYIAIYGNTVLQRYNPNRGSPVFGTLAQRAGGITNDPPIGFHPIHIIVKNGNVTLTGVVDNEMDRSIAEIQANAVPGVFAVTNNLEIPNDKKKPAK